MDANADQSWRRQGLLYPTMLIAAIAVIIFSMVGIAAMTGLLPSAMSGHRASDEAPATPLKRQPQDTPRALDAPRATQSVPRDAPRAAGGAPAPCVECGVVESVRALESKGEGSLLGAGAGAVVGGLLGNQIGGGRGRTAATVAGASAGAFAGNEIERKMNTRLTYQVRIRMNDGTHRNHYQGMPPKVAVGQRVRVSNGQVLADD